MNSELNATLRWIEAISETVDKLRDDQAKAHAKCSKELGSKVQDVQREVKSLDARHDKHAEYHKKNEHKFGVQKYIKDHIGRSLLIALVLGILAAGFFGITTTEIIRMYNHAISISKGQRVELVAPQTGEEVD